MNKQIVIIGASGHGKVVADIARKSGYEDIVFLDDNPAAKTCSLYPVVGTTEDLSPHRGKDFIVAIGNAAIRKKLQTRLTEAGVHIATLIHPNAVIGENVTLGVGTVVMAGAVVNPCAVIGNGCILNTCCSVDHDCVIGDYVHISVGAHVAGTAVIADNTWIGAGATVSNAIHITADCMVGAGAVVVHHLSQAGTYVGVPARIIKPKDCADCP